MRWYYRCSECGATYEIEPNRYLCDACSAGQRPDRPLAGILEVDWEDDAGEAGAAATAATAARSAGTTGAGETRDRGPGSPTPPSYALGGIPVPVEPEWFPPIPVGNTPLWEPLRLRSELGFSRLYLKDDTCNPTGSYKDRASYLVAAFAAKFGISEIALASTGNAASSMAGVGAAAGIKVTVFLPVNAPEAKRIQVLQYGAELRQVAGNYDAAYDHSLEYTADGKALSRNTAYNPLTIEGKKTVSYEIVEQLGALDARTRKRTAADGKRATAEVARVAPDHVFVPVGDGVILAGVYRGFENLLRLGRVERIPEIWACQAEGSAAIVRALEAGDFGRPVRSSTIADSISVDVPRNGAHALAKLIRHGGHGVKVSDQEILSAQRHLASRAGLFAEPSSAAAYAGFLKVRDKIDPGSRIVLLITGSGLKDIAAAARGLT